MHNLKRLVWFGMLFGILFHSSIFAQPANNHLTVGGPFEFTSLNPSQNGYVFTRMGVVETLVDVSPEGELLPGLATHWEVSEDRLSWRFYLRDDVVFHDGRLMDATSVVNSLEGARQQHGTLAQVPVDQLQAGDGVVEITLSSPYHLLPAVLAHYANVVISPDSFDEEGRVTQLLGSGSFRLTSVAPPHKLRVERFEEYWGQVASIASAEYLTGHRGESRVLQARSGQTDISYTIDPASTGILSRVSHVNLHSELIPRSILIKVNSGHPYLKEVEARQALSLALDRSGIAAAVLRAPGSEANQLIPAPLGDWHVADLPPMERDMQQATALLDGLGWQLGADGVRVRDNQRFSLDLITYADRPELTVVATAIQAQLAELGVEVRVSVTNSSAIPAGHQDGSLEMALIARNYGFIADPLGVMLADFGADKGGDWGAMQWDNTEVPALLKTLEEETDPQRSREISQGIARMLAEELPLIPVSFYTQLTAVNQRVQNFRFDPFERNYYLNEMELSQ
ncbi:ABC transporter substrate-binding protein [Nitrincola sp.]|uniref:ABC transporter substrate-binding protein n=1 Tax=Nitrincola sp. TaxID=1926584 RepID=UPI003A9547FF